MLLLALPLLVLTATGAAPLLMLLLPPARCVPTGALCARSTRTRH
jgi:hypothetical protein